MQRRFRNKMCCKLAIPACQARTATARLHWRSAHLFNVDLIAFFWQNNTSPWQVDSSTLTVPMKLIVTVALQAFCLHHGLITVLVQLANVLLDVVNLNGKLPYNQCHKFNQHSDYVMG